MQASKDDAIRQVTLRLPERLLRTARRVAKRRHLSLNALLRTLLEGAAEQERQAILKASYDALGTNLAESDVEPFMPAQAEVARRG
jgi:lauroyl/myristoyl acyltransferase